MKFSQTSQHGALAWWSLEERSGVKNRNRGRGMWRASLEHTEADSECTEKWLSGINCILFHSLYSKFTCNQPLVEMYCLLCAIICYYEAQCYLSSFFEGNLTLFKNDSLAIRAHILLTPTAPWCCGTQASYEGCPKTIWGSFSRELHMCSQTITIGPV